MKCAFLNIGLQEKNVYDETLDSQKVIVFQKNKISNIESVFKILIFVSGCGYINV